MVERRIKALKKKLKAIVVGRAPGTELWSELAQVMGPQFSTVALPSVEAEDIDEAIRVAAKQLASANPSS